MDARNVRLKRRVSQGEPLTERQQMIRFVLAIVAVLVLFILGVKWFNESRNRALSSSAELASRGLFLKLSMGKSQYNAGEPVEVQLLVKNVSDQEVTLQFDDDLEFDLTVQSEMDLLFTQIPQNIWQLSSEPDHRPRPSAHSIKIGPGKEHAFRGTWRQQTFGGGRVKPGRYIINGYLKANNHAETLQLRGQTQK